MIHLDVMDGHFVPNLTIGPPVIESLRKVTKMTFDVHLMISDPDRYISSFVQAGADQILVHQETCPHLDRTLRLIQSEGARAGVVINPATPVATLDDVLSIVDYVLVMSVNPGFGGQSFIPNARQKVRRLTWKKRDLGLQFPIEIDGGVTGRQRYRSGECRGGMGGSRVVDFSQCEPSGRFHGIAPAGLRCVGNSGIVIRISSYDS